MTDDESPPRNDGEYPRQVAPRPCVLWSQGRAPHQQITGNKAEPDGNKVFLDLKHAIGCPELEVLQARAHINSILRIEKASHNRGGEKQESNRRRVGRCVDVTK